jgi:hypothetical protein
MFAFCFFGKYFSHFAYYFPPCFFQFSSTFPLFFSLSNFGFRSRISKSRDFSRTNIPQFVYKTVNYVLSVRTSMTCERQFIEEGKGFFYIISLSLGQGHLWPLLENQHVFIFMLDIFNKFPTPNMIKNRYLTVSFFLTKKEEYGVVSLSQKINVLHTCNIIGQLF